MEATKINETICRLCLSTNRRVLYIKNTYLHELYEKLTNIKLNSNYIQHLCYICVKRLTHCHKLIQQAVVTDKLLKEALQCGIEIHDIPQTNTYKLSVSSTINLSLDPIEIDVKEENGKVKKEFDDNHEDAEKNVENESTIENQEQDGYYTDTDVKETLSNAEADSELKHSLSESEDDEPLVNISSKKHLKIDEPVVKVKKFKKYNKDTKVDAQELILDDEQQMMEMMERSKSLNYLNSPYKCDLCYKGFLDSVAFDKHKEKHDEVSGPYECKLCHLRYLTVKSLRAHTASTHSRRYSCNICGHRTHTKHQAKAHEQWHNGHTYPCKPCGRTFSKPTSYLSHVRAWHAGSSEHVCRECGESFAREHGLLMHRTKAHRGQTNTTSEPESERHCTECDIKFSTSQAKMRHLLTSKKHFIFKDNDKCSVCGVKVGASLRDAHARRHVRALAPRPAPAPPLALACEQCDSTFPSRAKLQNHVRRIHLGLKYNKNIVCEICGKSCTSNATLSYHQRRHTGEKPFPCESCPARFVSREQLRIHARSHSGERPYSCALCGNCFSQKPALNRHYRVHTGAKPYECHVCNKPFSQSNSLKTHIRTVHLRLPPNKKKKELNPLDADKLPSTDNI